MKFLVVVEGICIIYGVGELIFSAIDITSGGVGVFLPRVILVPVSSSFSSLPHPSFSHNCVV